MKTISLSEFWDMLAGHDWFHMMSEHQSVWRKGKDKQFELERIAQTSPEHIRLYNDYYNFAQGSTLVQPPKPQEPAFRTGEQKS